MKQDKERDQKYPREGLSKDSRECKSEVNYHSCRKDTWTNGCRNLWEGATRLPVCVGGGRGEDLNVEMKNL